VYRDRRKRKDGHDEEHGDSRYQPSGEIAHELLPSVRSTL
jgi:hypothetical protein